MPLFGKFLQILSTNASHYADLVFEKLIQEDYYDSDPTQFDVSEQVRKAFKLVFTEVKVSVPD